MQLICPKKKNEVRFCFVNINYEKSQSVLFARAIETEQIFVFEKFYSAYKKITFKFYDQNFI